jgi:hypothetical protein
MSGRHCEVAKERCEGMYINILVWEKMLKLLRELYANDDEIISNQTSKLQD